MSSDAPVFSSLFDNCPDTWEIVSLPEAVAFKEGPGILAKDFHEAGVPLLRLKSIQNTFATLDGCNFLDEEKVAKKWDHFRVEVGDMLVSTSATIGIVSEVTEATVGAIPYTGIIRMRPNRPDVDRDFIKYFMKSEFFIRQAEAMASGSVLRHYGPTHLRQMVFPIPPFAEQQAMGRILKSLDDKIELNRRMNATLESLARAIFKSWFVDFDPVKINASQMPASSQALATHDPKVLDLFPSTFQDSELGPIPQGWSAATIEDVCKRITSGGTPKTKIPEYWDGEIPWLSSGETGQSFIVGTEKTITALGVENSSVKEARKGSTVIASAGQGKTRGQTSLLLIDSYINQSTIALTAAENCSDNFLFFDLSRRYEEFRRISDAHSSRGSLTTNLLSGVKTVLPPLSAINRFEDVVSAYIGNINKNLVETRSLAALRDALLPQLLSGELSVSEAHVEVEQVA